MRKPLLNGIVTMGLPLLIHSAISAQEPRPEATGPVRADVFVSPRRLEVVVNSDLRDGEERDLHERIAAQFARQDFENGFRVAEFDANREISFRGKNVPRVSNWTAMIESLTETPDGWVVRLRVNPLFTDGASLVRWAGYSEEYAFKDGNLRLTKVILPAPPRPPGIIVWQ